MAAYIVCYDLHEPGQKYECLREKLGAYGTYWKAQQSVWVIVSSQSAVDIRNNLKTCLDNNDKLFVAKLSGEAAWVGYGQKVDDWLLKNL